MMQRVLWLAAMILSTSVVVAAGGSQGAWRLKVPEKDRLRVNPLAQDNSAVEAGARVFTQSCASCHGNEAEGRGHHPSLRTTRVHEASDGELQWLLRNGSLAHGMPAWSGLPEVQRWQVIRYLHSLPLEDHAR